MQMKQEAFCTVAFKISHCYVTNFSDLSDSFNLVCQQVIFVLLVHNQLEIYAVNIIRGKLCRMVDKIKLYPICSSCV